MTVKQLIAKLSKMPADAIVVTTRANGEGEVLLGRPERGWMVDDVFFLTKKEARDEARAMDDEPGTPERAVRLSASWEW